MSLNHKLLAASVLMALGATAQANPVADQARALIQQNPPRVQRGGRTSSCCATSIRDADGTEHVRFDRTYRACR
jgi:hypothetical protein